MKRLAARHRVKNAMMVDEIVSGRSDIWQGRVSFYLRCAGWFLQADLQLGYGVIARPGEGVIARAGVFVERRIILNVVDPGLVGGKAQRGPFPVFCERSILHVDQILVDLLRNGQ